MQTISGQCLDMISSRPDDPVDFSKFTKSRYDAIVKYKTAYYSFYLPVALAMYLVSLTTQISDIYEVIYNLGWNLR